MNDIGRNITKSVRFISTIGMQIEKLVEVIKDELSMAIKEIDSFVLRDGQWGSCVREDADGWVVTDYAYDIPLKLKGKGNKKAAGYLGFQISLLGDGIEIEGNEEPLLHVCWWDDGIDFQEGNYFSVPLNEEESFTVEHGVIVDFSLSDVAVIDQRWSYSLRLTSINTPDDVKNKIVQPVVRLLNKGLKEGVVLLEDLKGKGIVEYEQIADKPGVLRLIP